jgi:hypothetical protein
MCVCKRSMTTRSSIRTGLDHMVSETCMYRKIRVSSSDRSVMSHSVLKNAVVWTPEESRRGDWDGVRSCVGCVCNKTSYIP